MVRQEELIPGKTPYLSPAPAAARKGVQQAVSHQENQKKAVPSWIADLQFPTVLRPKIVTEIPGRGAQPTTTSKRRTPHTGPSQAKGNAPARPRQAELLKPGKVPPDEPQNSKTIARAPPKANAMVAKITTPTRRVTRSRATNSPDGQPQNEANTEQPRTDTERSADAPKPAARGKNKAEFKHPIKTAATQLQARESQGTKAVNEGEPDPKSGTDPATESKIQSSITVVSPSGPNSVPANAASRSRRPKAADFYETVQTPVELTKEATQPPTDLAPLTPKIPWDMYGITDSAESNIRHGTATEKKGNKTLPAKSERGPHTGYSSPESS
jgi:hypothetical protein